MVARLEWNVAIFAAGAELFPKEKENKFDLNRGQWVANHFSETYASTKLPDL